MYIILTGRKMFYICILRPFVLINNKNIFKFLKNMRNVGILGVLKSKLRVEDLESVLKSLAMSSNFKHENT